VYVCVCACVCMCVFVYVGVWVCACFMMRVYMCVCVRMCVCVKWHFDILIARHRIHSESHANAFKVSRNSALKSVDIAN